MGPFTSSHRRYFLDSMELQNIIRVRIVLKRMENKTILSFFPFLQMLMSSVHRYSCLKIKILIC